MITLKELAKLLNVSISTVSKALSDSNEIGEDTKKRVVELAKELNYKPNRIAQQLKSNKTNVIGIIIPSITNPFFAEVLHGIETTLEAAHYEMIVCISNEKLSKEQRSLELLASGSVDGFIISVAQESQIHTYIEHIKMAQSNKPIVMFDRVLGGVDCSKVVVDDFQSVYNATNYLIEQEGRKDILLLSNIEMLSVGKQRANGYTKAMGDAGLQPLVLELGNEKDPKTSIFSYLQNNPNIDAVISIDHLTGLVALNMLKELGKTIPNDVSVIGFGYTDAQLVSNPTLSFIDQKGFTIGEKAVKLLFESLNKDTNKPPRTLVVNSELQLHQTTLATSSANK